MTNNKRRDDPVTYGDFEDFSVALTADLKKMEERITHHFDAAVEKIEDDLTGANRDEMSALKDTDTKLDGHIKARPRRSIPVRVSNARLERRMGGGVTEPKAAQTRAVVSGPRLIQPPSPETNSALISV